MIEIYKKAERNRYEKKEYMRFQSHKIFQWIITHEIFIKHIINARKSRISKISATEEVLPSIKNDFDFSRRKVEKRQEFHHISVLFVEYYSISN